jgi:hypothetical protein
MVNQGDLTKMHGSIMERMSVLLKEGFENQARKLKQERQVDHERLVEKLEKDGADLKRLFEDKIQGLEDRVSELEKKCVGLEEKNGPVEDPVTLMHEEMQQVERRRANLVIHGLKEGQGEEDGNQIADLLEKVVEGGAPDFQAYRTGKSTQDRPRTTVVKFKSAELRDKYLYNAKNLKGKEEYKRVSLALDLTKKQREMGQSKEAALKAEAEKRNLAMTTDEKNEGLWIVVGRGIDRYLVRKRKA